MAVYDDLARCTGFQWDLGNASKNWDKHRVTDGEAEEIFFNDPLVAGVDLLHSREERRFYALGRTDSQRHLFVAFTIREDFIRVISARDMTAREVRRYTG